MSVRVRGIYATALTALFDDVVQASGPIRDRFDESFSMAPATVDVETTADRQGVGVHGVSDEAADVVSTLRSVGVDTLAWRAVLPRGGLFAGEVVETLGSGAIVDCAPSADAAVEDSDSNEDSESIPHAGETSGFLPYSNSEGRVEDGDYLRVQVTEPRPPWEDGRPVLDTTPRIAGGLADLVRGRSGTADGPELTDILPADPPEGWGLDWSPAADDAGLDELSAVIDSLSGRAETLDETLESIEDPETVAPQVYDRPSSTYWLWFGRDSRFELDKKRTTATKTMAGHHRIKAATSTASTAVDFVEAVCEEPGTGDETEFPFDVVTRQFGPQVGDSVTIGHGKPDGRLIELGSGEVSERTAGGKVTVRREMSSHGTYDALGTEREPTDVAVTKFTEGRWWYPTVYRGDSGESKGTYVNICTPVELFPDTVRYVDLHVDVIKRPDGTVERVDDDELDAAVAAGTVPQALGEKARTVAKAVENAF